MRPKKTNNIRIKNIQTMDIFYYSNYCKHSQKILQFLVKGNLTDKISFICIDKRFHDKKTNQTKIALENGSSVILPPNIHSVPALLLVNKNYQLILGDDIMKYYEPIVREMIVKADLGTGEPAGFAMNQFSGPTNIMSEQYTMYNMTPEELSAKGTSIRRPMYNYVGINDNSRFIQTPPDTYKPDKISGSITVDVLEKQRGDEIQNSPLFIPSL
jgi:hypothetical protein